MARLFCGFIDFEQNTHPDVATQMADRLNFGGLYTYESKATGPVQLVNLYSPNAPAHPDSRFIQEMRERFIIASYSCLVRLKRLTTLLELDRDVSDISDEELLLRAYLKWGKEMVHHLHGDWSFVIFDREKNEAFLARNAHADGTLFYYQVGKKLYFSSILAGLINIDGIPLCIDREKFFFESLTISRVPSKTVYKDIHFLRPGHSMSFNEHGLQQTQYWQPQNLPKTVFKRDEEYFEALLDVYTEAVQLRLDKRDRWGLALSGGLDSAATAAIASEHFQRQQKCIPAFCYTPGLKGNDLYHFDEFFGDESLYARFTAEKYQNLELELVTRNAPLWQYMAGFASDFGTAPHISNNWFAEAVIEKTRETGLASLMIAEGGNDNISFFGVPSHKTLAQLRCDLKHGLKLEHREIFNSFLKSIVGSTKQVIKPMTRKNRNKTREMVHDWTFLRKDFVESVHGYELLEDHLFNPFPGVTPGSSRHIKRMGVGTHCRLGLWNMIGARHDVVCIDPSRDKLLQELVLSVPNHIFHRNGEEKYLYKQTFKHKVPPEVIANPKRGFSFPDIVLRYQQDHEFFEAALTQKKDDPIIKEMVDFERLSRFYEEVKSAKNYDSTYLLKVKRKDSSAYMALFTQSGELDHKKVASEQFVQL